MADGAGALVRVLAVAERVALIDGGTSFVTAIEIWDRKVVVHVAEQHPRSVRPRDLVEQHRLPWTLCDDLGTEFVEQGSYGSGHPTQVQRTFEFLGEVPRSATALLITPSNMTAEGALRVPLS